MTKIIYTNKYSVGGRTLARRKPYKNDTRKLSNKARSKRIYKYKAIDSMQTSNG
jgi:hypothetical protein